MKLLNIYDNIINEAKESYHLTGRLKGRIDALSENEISTEQKSFFEKYLEIVNRLNYDPRYSFAIRLMELVINPESELYLNIRGREYYRINDFLGKDSTGNEIWAIVRNNTITTAMLRKDIQPPENLRCDYIAYGIGDLQKLLAKNLIK